MNEGIKDVVFEVLAGFNRLSKSIQESDDTSLRASLPPKIDDELARFKVWAGNSGAHRNGRASLEHRLCEASHVRQQVLRLLNGLKDSLEDAADIMNGKATPWEEMEDDEEPLDDLEMETEMEQITLDITELVDCLLRLSVSIQNPAPHDRFMSSTFTDASAYEDFDIQHVQAKFQDIDESLAQRLGKAMSRRRQYFKYREAHHQKLSHGLDRHGDTDKTEPTLPAPSTLASSIPLQMKQEALADFSGDDTQSEGRASATSFATSVSGPKTLKVPPMPKDALKGPFMCPFCYLIISVQDTRAWKKHVFRDLRPYNCLALHCTAPDREFSGRNEWMQHMLQDHLRVYRCPYGCPVNFPSAAESKDHLLRVHNGAVPESKVDGIVELSSHPLAQDAHTNCPFCPAKLKTLKEYRRHVGNHQQDLALFVLPHADCDNDDTQESLSRSESGTGLSVRVLERETLNKTSLQDGFEHPGSGSGHIVGGLDNPIAELGSVKAKASDRFFDLDDLSKCVQEEGGYATVTKNNLWNDVCASLGVDSDEETTVKRTYATYLLEYQYDLAKAKLPHGKIPERFDSGKNVEALVSTSEKNTAIHRTSSDVESSHSIEFSGDIPAENDQAFASVGRVTDIDTSRQKANIVRELAVENGREAEEDETIETGFLDEIYDANMSWESSHDAHAIDNSESKQIEPAVRNSLDHSAGGIMSPSSLFDSKSTAFGTDVLDYFVSSERLSQEHGQALEGNRPSSAMGIITTSQSLSASASYDEPSSEDFEEKSDSPTNYEKQFNSVIPSLQRQQSFDSDKGNRLAQRTLRRASDDSFGIVISTSRGLTEDRLKSLSIDADPGNKRRASSPPDADNVPDSASLKSEPVTSEIRAGSSQVSLAEALGEGIEADNKRTKAKVLYDFTGITPNELTVERNDLVDILHQGDKGWSLGMNEKQPGPAWIPTAYVEEQTTATNEQSSDESNHAEEIPEAQEKPERQSRPDISAAEVDEAVLEEKIPQPPNFQHTMTRPPTYRTPSTADDAKGSRPRAPVKSAHGPIWRDALKRFSEDVSRRGRGREPLPAQYSPQTSLFEAPNVDSPAQLKSHLAAGFQRPQHFRDFYDAGSVEPLTGETLKRSQRYHTSFSSDGGRSERDYRQSASTRATRRSAFEDENITIKVTGSAVLKIGSAEIQCQDDGEININQDSSPGRSGSIIAEPSRSDRGESPPIRRHSITISAIEGFPSDEFTAPTNAVDENIEDASEKMRNL
ncbi:hypothetical protein GCG54_00003259 [Colletotrichum gloeosporioides]|uniref:SH3 domain-containing protein n=1 Tax=Colletotrichum gloeosporioides TaxID=474922 RepID=A0A8H4CET5_COLGL|nr:uncharacterized protein GCG54_00003259 [Colletotrichum gloeosporioides]KAF3802456.1 hypothetical protein GCG54_00003259 [Colletotrichum gloeosporioides]